MYNFPVWHVPPVKDWLFHPERFFATPGREEALRCLCQKLQIEPVFTAGPGWLGMWATIGALLGYEHGGLKPRGRKKIKEAGSRIDVELVKAIEYVVEKRGLPFEYLLSHGIEWARELGQLAPADRTTDIKRLKRVKRRLDEERRSVKGLLDLPVMKPK